MKKYFITYGDSKYELTKKILLHNAEQLNIFDDVISYSPADLSLRVQESPLMKVSRGGGLWVWKPDVILKTLKKLEDNDILVYCDAGCEVKDSKEWKQFFSILNKYDICAFKIFQKNINWTRHEIIETFDNNPFGWLNNFQCAATIVILKKTNFTLSFIEEWLSLMIINPKMVMDVLPSERYLEDLRFIENRHDQALYSALIYKYYHYGYIFIRWEHFEGYDFVFKQAIIASRHKDCVKVNNKEMFSALKSMIKRVLYFFSEVNFI